MGKDPILTTMILIVATSGLVAILARQYVNSANKDEFQVECDTKCAPLKGVIDTRSAYARAWLCGCVPAEKK